MNKPLMIPLTQDIQKLNRFVQDVTAKYSEHLQAGAKSECWQALAKVTLVGTLLFNHKRGCEAERLLMAAYMQRNKNPLENKDITASLSEVERVICKTMSRDEISGKRGRVVPIIFTPELLNESNRFAELP